MTLSSPWFWAFLAVFGWALAPFVVASEIGKKTWFGVLVLALSEIPRIILALPIILQPRIDPVPPWLTLLGASILVASLAFAAPAVRITPLTRPDSREPLRTDGFYSIVRHPLMFCDAFWPLGYSLMLGSITGVLLTPIWFALCWLLTTIEEERLVEEYGESYRDFQQRVPRIIPGFLSRSAVA